jgi:hypothetical protein
VTTVSGCYGCDLIEGRAHLPGGQIHATATALWVVEHCVGPLGVGHVWELTEDEAQELRPLLRETSSVVADLTSPDQVYVCLWSHRMPVHIHFVVQPATSEQRNRYGGGANLQAAMFDAGDMPPDDEVAVFAERARHAFAV